MPRKSSIESASKFGAMLARQRRQGPRSLRPAPREAKCERLPISREQIEALLAGAVRDRDRTFAAVCQRALAGETFAINACKAAVYGI